MEEVWPAALAVTAREVRTLGPLFALRGLPARLRGRRPPRPTGARPLLDLFVEEGFVVLHRDDRPVDGRAVVVIGAAGVFWSPTRNHPVRFASAREFRDFAEPGHARTVARLEAFAVGNRTVLETETLVAGTDARSDHRFAPYWAIIRGPSGLIRRSWLAAIDRRSRRG